MDTETKNFKAVKNWIIIVLIITVSSYGIYTGVQDLKYGKEIWTDESRGILIEKCMEKLLPSFKSCLTEYQQKIKEAKTKASAQQNL